LGEGSRRISWDVNYYDNNYICQWATEYQWNDPTSYTAFSGAGMPWSPRCVNKPAWGVYGTELATITRASSPYIIYGSSCTASSNSHLGYVVNEVWGPTPMSLGGSLALNALTLTLSYRYSCNSSHDSCRYKETFSETVRAGALDLLRLAERSIRATEPDRLQPKGKWWRVHPRPPMLVVVALVN
jgi:hypothetical protein